GELVPHHSKATAVAGPPNVHHVKAHIPMSSAGSISESNQTWVEDAGPVGARRFPRTSQAGDPLYPKSRCARAHTFACMSPRNHARSCLNIRHRAWLKWRVHSSGSDRITSLRMYPLVERSRTSSFRPSWRTPSSASATVMQTYSRLYPSSGKYFAAM